MNSDQLIVRFDFRDFKYLSNIMKTQIIVDDPEVMVGLKDASIELDFAALLESDALGKSRFVNGGRVYFEANVFGYQTTSFTTKGFFDQLGYEEPMQGFINLKKLEKLKPWATAIVILLIVRWCLKALCAMWRQSFQGRKQKKD